MWKKGSFPSAAFGWAHIFVHASLLLSDRFSSPNSINSCHSAAAGVVCLVCVSSLNSSLPPRRVFSKMTSFYCSSGFSSHLPVLTLLLLQKKKTFSSASGMAIFLLCGNQPWFALMFNLLVFFFFGRNWCLQQSDGLQPRRPPTLSDMWERRETKMCYRELRVLFKNIFSFFVVRKPQQSPTSWSQHLCWIADNIWNPDWKLQSSRAAVNTPHLGGRLETVSLYSPAGSLAGHHWLLDKAWGELGAASIHCYRFIVRRAAGFTRESHSPFFLFISPFCSLTGAAVCLRGSVEWPIEPLLLLFEFYLSSDSSSQNAAAAAAASAVCFLSLFFLFKASLINSSSYMRLTLHHQSLTRSAKK